MPQIATHGLPRLTIAFFRATITALILLPLLKWRQPSWLKIERRDWPLFAALGMFGVAAFFVVYIYAIALIGMGVAAVLVYTAPAWVTIISAIFFRAAWQAQGRRAFAGLRWLRISRTSL